MKRFSFFTFFLLTINFTFLSCGSDDEDTCVATWDGDVKAIIETSCSYSGCHSGGTDANEFLAEESNDYTSYAAIKSNLDNGKFAERTLVEKNMPPAMFVQAPNPTELTQAQLDILQCWADAGYPEN